MVFLAEATILSQSPVAMAHPSSFLSDCVQRVCNCRGKRMDANLCRHFTGKRLVRRPVSFRTRSKKIPSFRSRRVTKCCVDGWMIEWMIDLPRKLQAPEVLKIAPHPCSLKTFHMQKRQTSSLGCRRKQKPDDILGDDGVGGDGWESVVGARDECHEGRY